MTPKFTEGPYRIRRAHEGYEIESDSGPVTTDAGMRLRDAVFFCAAPELFEALRRCEELLSSITSISSDLAEFQDNCIRQARAALAKAEGKP